MFGLGIGSLYKVCKWFKSNICVDKLGLTANKSLHDIYIKPYKYLTCVTFLDKVGQTN